MPQGQGQPIAWDQNGKPIRWAGATPTPTPTPTPASQNTPLVGGSRSWLDDVADAAVGFWKKQPIHPIDMAQGAVQAIAHPLDTGKALLEAQGKPAERAEAKFKAGDWAGGAVEVINYLLPIIGPQISEMNAQRESGQISNAEFVGQSIGMGGQVALPGAAKNLRGSVQVTPAVRNQNPVQQAAVAFGQREGIPIDAATATGNRVVRGVQYGADRSLGGAIRGQGAEAAQNAALTATGRRLASQVSPTATSPYQAGEGIQKALQARVQTYGQEANTAYDALRLIEESPALTEKVTLRIPTTSADGTVKMTQVTTDMQMPVNLKVVKGQLKPVYEQMRRQMPVAQQQMSTPLKAIQNILDAPDYLPASMVDMDLSAMKALARGEGPVNASQGLTKAAIGTLERELQKAVAKGGPAAQDALQSGRAATLKKYGVSELKDQLATEPVKVFEQATFARDAGIDRLTAIAKEAPQTMSQVGRAFLDDLIDKATSEGGFGKAGTIHTKWENLGTKTKQLLFPDAAHRANLDNFFRLAKTMSENPNPSGSGYQVGLGAQGVLLVTEPVTGAVLTIGGAGLSKLLHSPSGVRALTQGARLPLGGNRQAAIATFGTISNALRDAEKQK